MEIIYPRINSPRPFGDQNPRRWANFLSKRDDLFARIIPLRTPSRHAAAISDS